MSIPPDEYDFGRPLARQDYTAGQALGSSPSSPHPFMPHGPAMSYYKPPLNGRDPIYGAGPSRSRELVRRPYVVETIGKEPDPRDLPTREELGSRKKSSPSPPPRIRIIDEAMPAPVDAKWNPASRRDMTVHLELDIEKDIDDEIETLSFLKRMGKFRDAEEYIRSHLQDHMHELAVLAEYADMLLVQGSFHLIFESFDDEDITHSYTIMSEFQVNTSSEDSIKLLLVLHLARAYSEPNLASADHVFGIALRYIEARDEHYNDSPSRSEVQILCRFLELTTYLVRNTRILSESESKWAESKTLFFKTLLQTLLSERRTWEARDLVAACVEACGPRWTCELLAEGDPALKLARFLADWSREQVGESCDLCLLDILVRLLAPFASLMDDGGDGDETESIQLRNMLHERAEDVATSIAAQSPQSVKCRPYLEWILVRESLARMFRGDGRGPDAALSLPPFLATKPGWCISLGLLPIYVPLRNEWPGWSVSQEPEESDMLVHAVLEVAEELDAWSLQVACLEEMVWRSPQPDALLSRLDHLQLTVMGCKLGALRTRLSRYLVANDSDARRQLKKDLLELDPKLHVWRSFMHPTIEWCQRKILRALTLLVDGKSREAEVLHGEEAAMAPFLSVGLSKHLDVLGGGRPANRYSHDGTWKVERRPVSITRWLRSEEREREPPAASSANPATKVDKAGEVDNETSHKPGNKPDRRAKVGRIDKDDHFTLVADKTFFEDEYEDVIATGHSPDRLYERKRSPTLPITTTAKAQASPIKPVETFRDARRYYAKNDLESGAETEGHGKEETTGDAPRVNGDAAQHSENEKQDE